MAHSKTAILLALFISCALPLAGKGKANAAGEAEVSKPSAAPEYFEMVQALADRVNRSAFTTIVTDPSGKIVEAPDKTTLTLPVHYRAPTAAEIEKMGPLWPKVPPEKNAAYYFGKAILEHADEDWGPAGSATSLQPYGGDIEAIAKWVERNRSALEAMREGLKQDVYCMPWGIIEETGAPQPLLPLLSGLRQIGRDLTDAGFVEEVKGNPDRAASYYLECVRFGSKFRNATPMESLVGASVQATGLGSLDNLVANASLADETLHGIIVACRGAEVAQDAPARICAADSAAAESQFAFAKAPYRDDPKTLLYIRKAKALRDFSARKLLDELLQKKTMEAAYKKELKEFAGEETERTLQWEFGSLGRTNVGLRTTQIRAAIALYQKAKGRLPDSLDALCPDILPSVPIDPFSGSPMRYAKAPDGWKIWSVGPDNVDHGGQAVILRYYPGGVTGTDADIVYTAQVQSNIERRSKDLNKDLPK